MTYIFDMAGSGEYQGEELSCPKPAAYAPTTETPSRHDHQVELRLAVVESSRSGNREPRFPAGLDLREFITGLDD
jgi:hypothetical protein